MSIQHDLGRLAAFALKNELITEQDLCYSINQALEILGLDDFTGHLPTEDIPDAPTEILENILDWSFENGLFENNTAVYRDLFDSKIMNAFVPRPSQVILEFEKRYKEGPNKATDWYYKFSQDTNYIRMNRIKKNREWKSETPFGTLDITINLSKPEKDPKAIAEAKNLPQSGYPKCLLCRENEGYSGRLNHPGRHSHRIIPVNLANEAWFLQYSPYVYFNEHSIILKGAHDPMKIGRDTFVRLTDFVEQFPHYFIGSNADLPIVGGSILSHDHFQGGNYTFAMENASVSRVYKLKEYPDVEVATLNWPMSVIRLRHPSKSILVNLSEQILDSWREYSDESVGIRAHSSSENHNTVTPIARYKRGSFEVDLVLRNNRTSEEHPLGIFHPHGDVHHIKKENIGLIEVMGLAVLPARLETELTELANHWVNHDQGDTEAIQLHLEWLSELKLKYNPKSSEEARGILEVETGKKFLKVLEYAGVFKTDKQGQNAFARFIDQLD